MASRVELRNVPGGSLLTSREVSNARFITAVALTRTAKDIEAEGKRLMRAKLRDPRPYTLRAQAVRPATKQTLEAETFFREFAGKGIAAGKYLRPLEEGGQRRQKRSELALLRRGILKAGELLTPVSGGPFDNNDNGLGGKYTRLLSALSASSDPMQDRTAKSTARAKRKGRRPLQYFVVRNGATSDAIWERRGSKTAPVLWIVRSATYRPVLDFQGTARRVAQERMPAQWERAFSQFGGPRR